jgi:hypothetical protein
MLLMHNDCLVSIGQFNVGQRAFKRKEYLICDFLFVFRALIFISHGAAEHIRCYDDHATFLAENGYLVFGHDHGEYFFNTYYIYNCCCDKSWESNNQCMT